MIVAILLLLNVAACAALAVVLGTPLVYVILGAVIAVLFLVILFLLRALSGAFGGW